MSNLIGLNLKAVRILIHASAWFAPFLAPFIIYLIFKDKDIQRLSLQAIVFQIVFIALLAISFLLIVFLVGIPLILILGGIFLITPVVGIIYAIQDRHFSYPIVGHFIH